MTLETWSLGASGVSVLLGLVAIALSLVFYIQGSRTNTAASNTLAKVETLVNTIQQHAFGMLEQTILRIPSVPPLPLAQPTAESIDNEPRSDSNSAATRQTALDAETKALNQLYAAEMNLNNPAYAFMLGAMGGSPLLETERERLRALIAIKRAQLEKEYGVKFDHPQAPQRSFPEQAKTR
jgi:hypothetical protein